MARLRLVTMADPNMALGVAVRLMLDAPVYAAMPFGPWTAAINGQVNRGHYVFVLDEADQVVGYAGWALVPQDRAEAWADHGAILADEECREGDCVIFNAWIAKSAEVHRFLVEAVRAAVIDRKAIYFRRAYADSSTRVVRLAVTEFFSGHVARARARDAEAAV